MGKAQDNMKVGPEGVNVLGALLDCFDDIQNLQHLLLGVELALDGSEFADSDHRYACVEVTRAARSALSIIWSKIAAANDEDVRIAIAEALAAQAKGGL